MCSPYLGLPVSCWHTSPSEAFLPPTRATAPLSISEKVRIYLWALIVQMSGSARMTHRAGVPANSRARFLVNPTHRAWTRRSAPDPQRTDATRPRRSR